MNMRLSSLLFAAACAVGTGAAHAQTYPAKPIRVIDNRMFMTDLLS
jgi:hypothetical protein